jgi:hypothetical protein
MLTKKKLLFEVHLTTRNLSEVELQAFESFCAYIGAKPLVIELSNGEHYRQPMISKVFRCDHPSQIYTHVDELTAAFKQADFPITRVKIEVPLEIIREVKDLFPDFTQTYFEWHGKLQDDRLDALWRKCAAHNAHLSRNALKNDPHRRFVTVRDYESLTVFKERVQELKAALQEENWIFSKEEFEYCIYDSNVALDKGWIN